MHGALIARWSFDEPEGATAFASVGTINGTLLGNATFVPSGGVSAGAVHSDPGSGVSMGDNFMFDGTGSFSLQAWIKVDEPGTEEPMVVIWKHQPGSYNGYFLNVNWMANYQQTNKANFYSSGNTIASDTIVNDGQWHQLVAVYAASVNTSIYVDGLLQSAHASAGGIGANLAPFGVGGGFRGLIDEVRVYDNALSADEVQALYRNPGGAVPEPSTMAVWSLLGALGITVGWWRRRRAA